MRLKIFLKPALMNFFFFFCDPGKLLSGLVNGLLDRNVTVRKTYASAIGQIIHTAKETTVHKLFTKLSNWYFEKEDPNVRTTIGCALQAVAQYNGELLKEQFPIVIPLIFFAMHGKKTEGGRGKKNKTLAFV